MALAVLLAVLLAGLLAALELLAAVVVGGGVGKVNVVEETALFVP